MLVFMPLPEEEVVVPGHVLVVPKRMGARNLLDLKPDEMCRPAGDRAKSGDRTEEWAGSNWFSEFNKITDSAAAKPFTMRIFTSYPLLEEKRLELPRQEESSRRRRNTTSIAR